MLYNACNRSVENHSQLDQVPHLFGAHRPAERVSGRVHHTHLEVREDLGLECVLANASSRCCVRQPVPSLTVAKPRLC
jgi:hypothetical protein